jgi:hypothetical protein
LGDAPAGLAGGRRFEVRALEQREVELQRVAHIDQRLAGIEVARERVASARLDEQPPRRLGREHKPRQQPAQVRDKGGVV